MVWENVLAKFKELFGDEGEIGVYFAPGRVNMIGEHTDYNGGHVFPCALTIGTYGVARKRADKTCPTKKTCPPALPNEYNYLRAGVNIRRVASTCDEAAPHPRWSQSPSAR